MIIAYPDESHKIALPIAVYDVYTSALKKESVLFRERKSPIGDESASIMSYTDELSKIDIKSFYAGISKMKDTYDLVALNKFVDQMHGTIAELCDLCITMSNDDDNIGSTLYYKCIQDNIAHAFDMVHRAFPTIVFDLSSIVKTGIEDMRNYTDPKQYYGFEDLSSDDKKWIATIDIIPRIKRFAQYDYTWTDAERAEIIAIEAKFRTPFGIVQENTDGNGE